MCAVVIDTTKVQIFKQITTGLNTKCSYICCYRYHKGTDFQANHNSYFAYVLKHYVVIDTTKVQIFKQITTSASSARMSKSCYRYHKGTDFQANHNY